MSESAPLLVVDSQNFVTPAQISDGGDTGRRDALPAGFPLNAYRVERVLGSGGFGIVYLAHHEDLDRQVAIKEYLPVECAVRDGCYVNVRSEEYRDAFEQGLTRFRDEARRLVELDEHPAIVSCRDFFRANGTAYLLMEYVEGQPLSEVLRAREAEGRPFGQSDLLDVIVPLLEGLEQVHVAGIIHRDIKPGNIMIREKGGQPVLLDFGAAKQGVAELSKSMAPYTEGYAAFEQVGEGKLGPWTDIYAVGAVMWRMVAGGNAPWIPLTPVRVESRAKAELSGEHDPLPSSRVLGKGRFSAELLTGIGDCLRLRERDRIQNCSELLRILTQKSTVGTDLRKAHGQAHPQVRSLQNRGAGLLMWAVMVLVLIGLSLQFNAPSHYSDRGRFVAVQRAAEQGNAEAQYRLGRFYADGEGVLKDYGMAWMWFQRAAIQGNVKAQYQVGHMHDTGTGVSKDEGRAAVWFGMAAEQGNVLAQYRLGRIYASNEGVLQDDVKAYAWWNLAAAKGYASASAQRALVERNMTTEQIDEALRLSQELMPH